MSHASRRAVDRRTFLLGAAASGLVLTRSPGAGQAAMRSLRMANVGTPEALFSLGVASGDPWPDGVVLWTRLAPMPFEDDGGMGDATVEVVWEVATDESMRSIVRRGTATATGSWAHSVHVEVSGLEPASWYWYRFRVGDAESPIGRTRTAPAAASDLDGFRFAFASCQRWDAGLYTAYRDMATRDVDLVVHLGDYIYESPHSNRHALRAGEYPQSAMLETRSVEAYRARYALYKLDPDLQEMHRLAPWVVTWDDHEVDDNYFGELRRDEPAARALLERRTAAYQAYYEHQPLRATARPRGPDLQLYRRLAFGNLLELNVLDTRQYRSFQGAACHDDSRAGGFCPDSLDPERTMLGATQKRWLTDGVARSAARWNVLAQQVPFARVDNEPSPALHSFGGAEMDKWDGYAVERDEVASSIAAAAQDRSFNPVVITGDVHANSVWDLSTDWDADGEGHVFGTEFVGTSISSNGDQALDEDGGFTTLCGNLRGNVHNHLFDNHRGYVLCELSPDAWRAEYRVMDNVTVQAAAASILASFVVEHGRPGAQQDDTCAPSRSGFNHP